jgi:UDP-N-acetylmuramoyl-tripeptide--D-alanyl-D-alanine ligase
MIFFTLRSLAKALNISCTHNCQTTGLSVDTRTLLPGNVFIALKGGRRDGHLFLAEAASKGAVAAIVTKNYRGGSFGMKLLPVETPLTALHDITRKMLGLSSARIIAVTGSHGKTTTKDFITTLLKTKYPTASTRGNYNNNIGLPLSIAQTKGDEKYIVLEMGMNHPGEIEELVSLAPPHIAAITNIAPAHIANFSSIEDIAREKAQILTQACTKTAFINADIPLFSEIVTHGSCKKHTFSHSGTRALYHCTIYGDLVTIYRCTEKLLSYNMHLPGRHNIYNYLVAALVANEAGMSWKDIRKASPLLVLPPHRFKTFSHHDINFIDDTYNASSPIAVKAALDSLPQKKYGGRTIAVLGEMLEQGKYTYTSHEDVAFYAMKNVDEMFCFGKGCEAIGDVWKKHERPIHMFSEVKPLLEKLLSSLQPNDTVLIKGSRGCALDKLVADLCYKLDRR